MKGKLSKKAQETKDRIIVAAEEILLEKGYEKMTLREIAKQAGVTTGAIYKYFDSKDAIIFTIFAGGFSKSWARADELSEDFTIGDYIEADANLNRDLAETFGYELLRVYYFAQCTMENSRYMWMLLDKGEFDKKDTEHIRMLTEKYETKYTAQEVNDMIFKVDRGGFIDWIISKGSYDLADSNRELMRIAFKGIFPKWNGE